MSNDGSIGDWIQIRKLYGQYAAGGSRGDTESWLSCWDEECHWITSNFERHGKEDLHEQWGLLWENFVSAVVLYEVGPIEVFGDRATASCGVLEIIKLASGGTLKIAGLYNDEFVRNGGKWLFRSRKYDLVSEEAS